MRHSWDSKTMSSEPECKSCFSTLNQPQVCSCCGVSCLPSSSNYIDSKLCKACYDSAGEYNSHSDGHHHKFLENYYGVKATNCPSTCPFFHNVECMHEVPR